MSIQTSTQNMPRPNLARHTAIRVGWMICVVLSLVVFLFAIPVRYAQFLSPEDEVRLGLTQLGYSEQYIEQYGSETATRDAMKP
ncbi:MAG TPA: hypothetical protein PK530_05980, partial [Anaerolineales bacterium]|nr:hypothetical protein [Anaerolineales bacterium]